MMSAAIARENYITATAANTATIMASIADRTNTILAKVEQLINQYSHEGRKELPLRFLIRTGITNHKEIGGSSFYQCEWYNTIEAYGIHVFSKIREGHTVIELSITEQRDLILNVLRTAGYEVQQLNNSNWVIKWA